MAPTELPDYLFRRLPSADLQRYALAAGWVRSEVAVKWLTVFHHPGSDLDQLLIPIEGQEANGYTTLAREAVRKLAAWEGRSVFEVLRDIVTPPDKAELDLVDGSVRNGDSLRIVTNDPLQTPRPLLP